jgi:hypothetical protein
MAEEQAIPTALGQPVKLGGKAVRELGVKLGKAPLVLQTQTYAYIPLEQPEQLKQWEADLHRFYGISVDASELRGVACETCSCGCTDDCGFLE